jgi:hypothetical protein
VKSEADVWGLNEISVTVRVPPADPDFLKTIEDRGRTQNEQSSDESGAIRAATDGKGTTCLRSGEIVDDKPPVGAAAVGVQFPN